MAYIPVAQRKNESKPRSYTPVAERTNVDLRDPLGTDRLIRGATMLQTQKDAEKTPIQRLSERDMSQDVISAPPPGKAPSPLGRAISAILPESIAQPIRRAGRAVDEFLVPTQSQQMKLAFDELGPGATTEEIAQRAQKLDEQMWIFRNPKTGEGRVIDPTGAIGTTKNLVSRLVKETGEEVVERLLRREATSLSDDAIRRVAPQIARESSEEGVTRILREAAQERKGYTPVAQRTAQAADDIPEELATEARKYDTAEEFVEAQPKVFHGTPVDFKTKTSARGNIETTGLKESSNGTLGSGFYAARTEMDARLFGSRKEEGRADVVQLALDPNAKIYKADTDTPFNQLDDLGKLIRQAKGKESGGDIKTLAQKKGYDGVEIEGRELVIYNKNAIKTKSQLTDIFNRVKGGASKQTPVRVAGAASERLNFPTSKSPMDEKTVVQRRRSFVKDLRDRFGLTDAELRQINKRDIRLMDNYEFKRFIDGLEQKAVELADRRQAKAELVDLLNRRNFQRVENFRRTQNFPPVRDMNAQQLRQYAEALEQFQVGDEFLTQRQLEVVDRTNLKGVKTTREAKKRLLEQIRQMDGMENVTLDDLNVTPSALDNLRYDTALAEKNPLYNFIVNRTQAHMLAGEAEFLQVQNKVNELARKANRSRRRGVTGSIRQVIIPKHNEIVQYLEAPADQKAKFAQALTPEELDYANYIQQYYSDAYDHLLQVKELYGSRYVDQYFTHVRKQFLEEWSDNGVISAVRNWYTAHKEDQMIANIIDQDTGNILPKAKFFQFTLQRTGAIEPSKNVTRVFLQYAKMFERKKMFDQMIPEVDIYTQSLTPKNLTPRGLEMDRSIKTLVNKYLNNKKGRRENFGGVIKQNGPADMLMRMGNTFVSLMDLGFNVGASAAATIGEQVMTYQALGKLKYSKAWKRRLWDTGIKRMGNKNASKILKEAEPFIGRNIWTELAEPDKGIGERGIQLIFGAFSQSSVEANKLFLLGSISKAELQAGKLSSERLAQLRLEAGRWRDMGRDVKSIVGSTSIGDAVTKYKGWAVPIARTNIKNITELTGMLRQGELGRAITSREAAETYRAIEMSTVLVLVGSYVLSEEQDDTFVGKLKARAYQEAMTLLGGTDPTLFLATPRLYSYMQQLAENLKLIVQLEEYQQNSQWGNKGDLKGLRGLQRQVTPAALRQFQGEGSTGGSVGVIGGGGAGGSNPFGGSGSRSITPSQNPFTR